VIGAAGGRGAALDVSRGADEEAADVISTPEVSTSEVVDAPGCGETLKGCGAVLAAPRGSKEGREERLGRRGSGAMGP
jgi:hypothetical protein